MGKIHELVLHIDKDFIYKLKLNQLHLYMIPYVYLTERPNTNVSIWYRPDMYIYYKNQWRHSYSFLLIDNDIHQTKQVFLDPKNFYQIFRFVK